MNNLNYKESSYNFEFPYKNDEGKRVLYNSRTNALALIDKEKYMHFRSFKERGEPILDEKLLEDLKHGGYILRDDIDELELIRFNLLQSRYNTSSLGLTIAPTSDCNFRCVYCYEKDIIRPVIMSENIQNKVVDFVRSKAKSIDHLIISWYGGEPLLALNIIEDLTKRFLEICEEHKIRYDAGIVTNGYLLTFNTVARFKNLKISSIQVTLDGSPDEHNKRRPLINGKPTFDKILTNLREIKKILPCNVSIRVNTDKHNVDQVDDILSAIKKNELENFVHTYLARVENSNNSYNDTSCFQSNEFSKIDYDFKIRNELDMVNSFPKLIYNVCTADSQNGFVINADGSMYKCWDDIGISKRCIGNLLEQDVYNVSTLLEYMLYDPTQDEECRNCKYLPICMGGCPHRRLFDTKNRCAHIKYRLNDYMALIPSQIKERRNTKADIAANN